MQVVRTIIWVLILVGVLVFSFFNWREVEVTIWDNLVLETKVPALVIISFLLGFLPTWLYARGVIWSLNRKIRSLEIAAKASSVSAAARESDREAAEQQTLAQPQEEQAQDIEGADDAAEDTAAQQDETRLAADDPEPASEEPVAEEATAEDTSDEPPADEPVTDETSDGPEEERGPTQDRSTTT